VQINAIKFRLLQNDEPITYKFSQSSGKFANFQSVCGTKGLLANLRAALEFSLTGKIIQPIYDTVLQVSDNAGQTWIIHRTLNKVRIVKNGSELKEDQLNELHAAFLDYKDDYDPSTTETFTIAAKTANVQGGKIIAFDANTSRDSGIDIRSILEDQIATITEACVKSTGLNSLLDPSIMIRLTQKIEPIYNSFSEICNQYRTLKNAKNVDFTSNAEEIKSLQLQIEIIKELEAVAGKFLAPNFTLSKSSEDLAVIDGKIAELAHALNIPNIDTSALTKDFRKPIEAIARLEVFAKLIRASQGARKYCEQKIEPTYKKYLSFADRSLANNRQIASELENCLSTLALRLKAESTPNKDHSQSLKTWFERFKSKNGNDDPSNQQTINAQNDFDTARLAIEYAVTQLNEMANHLKIAVDQNESALNVIDESHEALVSQYNQLKSHWIATANAIGIPTDIDSTQMIKIIVAHGRLVSLIEKRNQLAATNRQQESDLIQIEDFIIRWRSATGSQKSLDLSSPGIVLREARDIIRYREARIRRLEQLQEVAQVKNSKISVIEHLKARRAEVVSEWEEVFASFGMEALSISDKYNRELFKRASIVRGLALAWTSSPGVEPGGPLFSDVSACTGLVIIDTSEIKFDHKSRMDLLNQIENAEGNELRLILVCDEQLSSLISAMAIGSAVRVVQASPPTVNNTARPTPVAKIIRKEKGLSKKPTQDMLSERAQQMLDLLSPRK